MPLKKSFKMPLYYGQNDNENTLPYLVGCVFVYFAYKWIKSANNTALSRVSQPIKKASVSNALVAPSKLNELDKEAPIRPKTTLNGSLANLNLKKVAADNEVSKDAVEEDLKVKSDSEATSDAQAKIASLFGNKHKAAAKPVPKTDEDTL